MSQDVMEAISSQPQPDDLNFELPPELEASGPPESRGLTRDGVRLMVSGVFENRVTHARFRDLGRFLRPGDLLVINTSGTRPAALPATAEGGRALRLHLSTQLPADLWVVELREPAGPASRPHFIARAGDVLQLPEGARATLLAPYTPDRWHAAPAAPPPGRVRLWVAALDLRAELDAYLTQHGQPIRYGYAAGAWPLSAYQTVYATEPGSAEMPSAGRAFTHELLAALVAAGVRLAPLLLHAGVSSPEEGEPLYEEYFRVPDSTARLVNDTRAGGGRVIAVGTTVVRALESATDARHLTHPAEGHTRLLVTPERGVRAVHGLLTGLHEPRASHLQLLAALAGRPHLALAYREALKERYLWHEFGDLHLILP